MTAMSCDDPILPGTLLPAKSEQKKSLSVGEGISLRLLAFQVLAEPPAPLPVSCFIARTKNESNSNLRIALKPSDGLNAVTGGVLS
jgi:hypothetical protein